MCLRLTLYFKGAHLPGTRESLCLCFDAFHELAGDALSWLWREKPKYGRARQRVKDSRTLREMIEPMSEDDHLSFCYTGGANAEDAGAWQFLVHGKRGWQSRMGNDMSVLELSVPASQSSAKLRQFIELAIKCAHWLSAEHGHAGYALNLSPVRRERNEPIEAVLAQRLPGLDAGNAALLANRAELKHPKFKTVSWLTLLDDTRLAAAGGLDQLCGALPGQYFKLHTYGGGALIQAGSRPLACADGEDPRPPEYVLLDHYLREIRAASLGNLHFNPKSAEPRLIGQLADHWVRRFEVDASDIPTHEARLARQHALTYEGVQAEPAIATQLTAQAGPQRVETSQ
ncbi:TPA: DUF3396 domain-containing protein [Stenotrophomonas maltophilia]|nr:DUF3396 domain-containing protein [Stenotrophomonas maltophilia]HDS1026689.1 DUF3396 domain-containing protein [Stenotrophomonas maltophilia]HDS1030855.1 DUF3396 domain-containing protein [Stenotrophomonas maltophilia]HDS1035495.1 DUF3396 domain-containing protein [Stenotrophomonas maltophilia]